MSWGGFLLAQQPATIQRGIGKVSGIVLDSVNNQAVEFATVAIIDPSTGKPFDGSVCDEKGKFSVTRLPNGNFKVSISFIGYTTKILAFRISERNPDFSLGTIKLSPATEILKEVVVSGQKAIIEERVDRTVYNAENDNTTKGGDAADVMRRVPMLSVDLDGNVSMRGNSNVTVLINNKPSTVLASSVADALRQIPADQIKSVEVITSPSAKYDAEGSAGIINIITKKNTLQGLTLGIDAGVGLRGSNLGLNGNYRKGKMGFNLGGWGRAGYNVTGGFENNQNLGNILNVQTAETRRNDIMGRYQLGWDYDINKSNSLAASVRFGVRNSNNYQDNLLTKTYNLASTFPASVLPVPSSTSLRQVDVADLSNTIDLNLDYTHYYKKPQRELSFLTLFSRNNRTNNFENIIQDPTELDVLSRRRNDNRAFNQEITFQADYQTPISTNQMLEMGGKRIIRNVSSDYDYFISTGTAPYVKDPNGSLSNIFNYDQNVTAGYLSYTLTTKSSFSFKAGSRYEWTDIKANFANATEIDTNIPSYGVLVPSFNMSKKLANGKTVKLAYNKRIQRPGIQFLNPNIQAANPLNITIGNPNLNPEFTDNYELSYSTFIKGSSLNFSGFYRNTTGAIQSIRETFGNGDTLKTRFDNIGVERSYGMNFFGNVRIGKSFSLNGGSDVIYAVLDNNLDGNARLNNEGLVVSGRLFGNYNLKNGWGLQFFSFYRGRRVLLQGLQGGFGTYSLSFRKDFANKKGSFGMGAENFFAKSMRIRNEIESPAISQKSVNVLNNISIRFNVNYRIGKMSFDQPTRRKKSVNNDDLKDGGGGGEGMGGVDQGGGQRSGGAISGGQSGRPPMGETTPSRAKPVETDKKKKEKKAVQKSN
ncbi:MAG: TonB-dependent receptor domain-containing protein [Cyclobacteriaceae bacterium]